MNVFDYFFEETKELSKDLVAGPRETISYNIIYSDALKLAHRIKSDSGENQTILVLCENSVFSVTVYLALLKSGNICVPLNPNIEPENLHKILSKTGATVAYANKKYAARFSNFQLRIIDEDVIKSNSQSSKCIN